jgi:hypothetical protein
MSADSWNITAEPSVGVWMLPELGRSSPAMRLSSVDLPQPDAPSRQTNSPGAMSSATSSSTSGPSPNRLETPSMRTAGVGGGPGCSTGVTPSKLGPRRLGATGRGAAPSPAGDDAAPGA